MNWKKGKSARTPLKISVWKPLIRNRPTNASMENKALKWIWGWWWWEMMMIVLVYFMRRHYSFSFETIYVFDEISFGVKNSNLWSTKLSQVMIMDIIYRSIANIPINAGWKMFNIYQNVYHWSQPWWIARPNFISQRAFFKRCCYLACFVFKLYWLVQSVLQCS